jgi:recombinational DNA repair protein RecR
MKKIINRIMKSLGKKSEDQSKEDNSSLKENTETLEWCDVCEDFAEKDHFCKEWGVIIRRV